MFAVFKTALVTLLLAPAIASAEGPRLGLVYPPGVSEVQRLRAENAVRSQENLAYLGSLRTRGCCTPQALEALGQSHHADLLLVLGEGGIRLFDVERARVNGAALAAETPVAGIRRFLAEGVRRWQASRPSSTRTPWLAYLVAGAAAAAFVALVTIRASDEPDQSALTMRFVSP